MSKILSGAAIVICAAFLVLGSEAFAEEPVCRLFKIRADNVMVSKEPRGDATFIDVLDTGDIVCVTRDQKTDGRDWAFIAHKLVKPGQRKLVNGWANPKQMQEASVAELTVVQPPPASAPATQAAAPSVPTAGEKIVRFSDPIPFGPISVAGKTLELLAEGDSPLFPPLEGIPDALWKKPCATCHNWTKETLCEQGARYVKEPALAFRNQHPYGGPMKVTLLEWTKQGCQ